MPPPHVQTATGVDHFRAVLRPARGCSSEVGLETRAGRGNDDGGGGPRPGGELSGDVAPVDGEPQRRRRVAADGDAPDVARLVLYRANRLRIQAAADAAAAAAGVAVAVAAHVVEEQALNGR